MAKLDLGGRPVAILGLIALVIFGLLLAWATYAAEYTTEHVRLGALAYLMGIGITILGFAGREDSVAVGGIVGLNVLVMLDIFLRIGVLPKF